MTAASTRGAAFWMTDTSDAPRSRIRAAMNSVFEKTIRRTGRRAHSLK